MERTCSGTRKALGTWLILYLDARNAALVGTVRLHGDGRGAEPRVLLADWTSNARQRYEVMQRAFEI
jgi:hypothetical protein